jgi:predicted nucleic acid-binding protein
LLACPKAGGGRRWPQPCSTTIFPIAFYTFEAGGAARYPEIVLGRRQAGKPIEKFDALIAATALAAGDARYRRVFRLRPHRHRSLDGVVME